MNQSNSRTLHTNRSSSNTPISRSVNDLSSNETSTTEISIVSKTNKNQASKQVSPFKSSTMIRSNSTFNMKSKPMVPKKERKVQSAMPDIPTSNLDESEESIILKPRQQKATHNKVNETDLHNVYLNVSHVFFIYGVKLCSLILLYRLIWDTVYDILKKIVKETEFNIRLVWFICLR